LLGQQHQGRRAEHGPARRPDVPTTELAAGDPQAGPVGERARQGVGQHRGQRAEAGDHGQHVLLVAGRDLLDLLRQQHLDGREERHPHAEVGREDQADPAAQHRHRRLGERRRQRRRRRVEGGHRADPGRLAAITSRNQVYDDFGVRVWVA
jgi:hypothetical protein